MMSAGRFMLGCLDCQAKISRNLTQDRKLSGLPGLNYSDIEPWKLAFQDNPRPESALLGSLPLKLQAWPWALRLQARPWTLRLQARPWASVSPSKVGEARQASGVAGLSWPWICWSWISCSWISWSWISWFSQPQSWYSSAWTSNQK